jgi:hypothetical protein
VVELVTDDGWSERFVAAMRDVRERQKPETIQAAIAEHGFPEHLLGLLGRLWAYAEDLPYDFRDPNFNKVMRICDDIFDHYDPGNDLLYPKTADGERQADHTSATLPREALGGPKT